MKVRVATYLVVIISVIITYQVNRSETKQLEKFEQSNQIVKGRLGSLFYQLQAVQYGMSQLSTANGKVSSDKGLNFQENTDGTCHISKHPSKEQMYDFETNFLVVSERSGCEPNSILHNKIRDAIKIAPMMTFLAGRYKQVVSLYFISLDKFIISSPTYNALVIKPSEFESKLFNRPYMQKPLSQQGEVPDNQIFISGPYADFSLKEDVMTFSIAIFMGEQFYGVLNMDVLWHDLVAGIDPDFYIIHSENAELPASLLSDAISFEGMMTDLRLVMPNSLADKLKYLIQNSLLDITFYFIAIVLSGWALYTLNLRVISQKFAKESHHDPLTGLLNRRGFMAELKNIERYQYYSFMIIDLDNFKHVNDTYGHPVGDDVLIRVTTAIQYQIREKDIFCRLGGEEFGLLIGYNKDNKQINIFERICESVANLPHYHDDIEFNVTMSGGAVTTSSVDQIKSIKSIIKQADELLYEAKIAGKNRVLYGDFNSNNPLVP